MSDDIDRIVKETEREIQTRPIVKLKPGQWADECMWSRTGWAAWEKDGETTSCTCMPVEPPAHGQ